MLVSLALEPDDEKGPSQRREGVRSLRPLLKPRHEGQLDPPNLFYDGGGCIDIFISNLNTQLGLGQYFVLIRHQPRSPLVIRFCLICTRSSVLAVSTPKLAFGWLLLLRGPPGTALPQWTPPKECCRGPPSPLRFSLAPCHVSFLPAHHGCGPHRAHQSRVTVISGRFFLGGGSPSSRARATKATPSPPPSSQPPVPAPPAPFLCRDQTMRRPRPLGARPGPCSWRVRAAARGPVGPPWCLRAGSSEAAPGGRPPERGR